MEDRTKALNILHAFVGGRTPDNLVDLVAAHAYIGIKRKPGGEHIVVLPYKPIPLKYDTSYFLLI